MVVYIIINTIGKDKVFDSFAFNIFVLKIHAERGIFATAVAGFVRLEIEIGGLGVQTAFDGFVTAAEDCQ
jgi:hypothetical protein